MSATKVQFIITVMVHAHGEATLSESEQGDDHIFIHPPQMSPAVTIIGPTLNEEDQARLKLMALHTLLGHAAKQAAPKGMTQIDSIPINMAPIKGEKS